MIMMMCDEAVWQTTSLRQSPASPSVGIKQMSVYFFSVSVLNFFFIFKVVILSFSKTLRLILIIGYAISQTSHAIYLTTEHAQEWTLPACTRGKPQSGTDNDQVSSLNQKEIQLINDRRTFHTFYIIPITLQFTRRHKREITCSN